MLPQYYKLSHGLYLNSLPQVLLIGNKSDQVPLVRYINLADEVYHLVRVRKVIGDMKYLMTSVKQASDAVGTWTAENWDMKRVNSLYTMVSGRVTFKINKRFDSMSWSFFVRDIYTRRGYITGELNKEQKKAWQARKKKR